MFGALAVYCALASLLWPRANRPVYLGISLLSFPVGFLLSYLLVGVLFFLIIGPAALVMRMVGHDPMNRRYRPEAPTYWTEPRRSGAKDRYFRQF
jgi:hypothetical protein